MFTHFFIDRPVFSTVISIVIVLGGLVALWKLPIAQYPEITPPQIQVTAAYPGASAELVSENVAAPIEQQVNGADGMLYMYSSSSSTGNMTLNIFFDIGRDPDLAQVDVTNRVNLSLPQLPEVVKSQGVSVKKVSTTFLMIIAVFSPDERYSSNYVANFANLYVLDALKRLPGVNQASIFGIPEYAMRIWVQPDRMAELKISAQDIVNAVRTQNEQFAVGRIGQAPTDGEVLLTFPVTTKGRLGTPEEFEEIILRAGSDGAAMVKIKDVGRVELGARDYSLTTKLNGREATLIAVYQQPGANSLEVSKQVTSLLKEMKGNFPDGIDYKISLDTTKFIEASIREVVTTFFEACLLVILVVLLFLGTMRATFVPLIAIPVSIIGTFSGMIALGFTINMLTLFGLVLAIGIVVDDAIVVIENVERNMHAFGLNPIEATKRAMSEVVGPIIATTLVTLAVFVPVAFLGGITGQLYKQFAITIAISVFISSIVALTLSPALTALLLKHEKEKHAFFRAFDRFFDKVNAWYVASSSYVIASKGLFLALFSILLLGCFLLFRLIPGSFVPAEDQGYLFGIYMLPDGASLERTSKVGEQMTKIMAEQKGVDDVVTADGFSLLDGQMKTNAGVVFVSLKDFDERKDPSLQAGAIVQKAYMKMAAIKEAFAMPINPPPIPGLGAIGGFEFWIQNRGEGDFNDLNDMVKKFIQAAKERKELSPLTATINANSMQLLVQLDREKAETLGVPIQNVYDTLQTLFGSLYVSQFNKFSRLFQVIVQAEASYRSRPEDINRVYVRNSRGGMIPLSSVVTTAFVPGADLVTRFNNFPAAKISGSANAGFSSGQAMQAMEELAKEVLEPGYGFAWSGQSYEEKLSGNTSMLLFAFGLVMVFLILAAQYEQWSLPFAVILAIPFALFGALTYIGLKGMDNDVYFQIGLVTLIALAAKNAILLVEFAVQKRAEGLSIVDSAREAARLRLRPILMTALSFILGCIPLVLATGASSKSRESIGTGVIGGMLGATVIAIFFIPLFYVLLQTFSEKFFGKKEK